MSATVLKRDDGTAGDDIESHLRLAAYSLECSDLDATLLHAEGARFLLSQERHELEAAERAAKSPDELRQLRNLHHAAELQLTSYNKIRADMSMVSGLSKAAAPNNVEDIDRSSLEAAIRRCEDGYNLLHTYGRNMFDTLCGAAEENKADMKEQRAYFLSKWADACTALGAQSSKRGSRLLGEAKGRVYSTEIIETCISLFDDALRWHRTILQIGEEAQKQGIELKQEVTGHAQNMASAISADRAYALMLQGKGFDYNLFCIN